VAVLAPDYPLDSVLLDERVAVADDVVWFDLDLGEGTGHSERSRKLIDLP
jgi:hypothetical protein